MKKWLAFWCLVAAIASPALAVDRIVDASGAGGAYTTIGAAMLASTPGDRILVMPGSYPTFQFSRGVHVIGMGTTPGAVQVQRIAYHPSTPQLGYDTLISNLTVGSAGSLDTLAIHGNELGPGVLTIDGVVLFGGLYLRGGQAGFYALISNSRIEPLPGYGFTGEAAWMGGPGNYIEIRNSRIRGWNSASSSWMTSGVALRVAGGTQLRINGSVIAGGDGEAAAGFEAGATAIASTGLGGANIRLDGGTIVSGGDGAGGPGGHGTAITGSIVVGAAVVAGGTGSLAGLAYAGAQPASLNGDLNLDVTPNLAFAESGVSVTSGQTLTIDLGPVSGQPLLALTFAVKLPESGLFVPLPLETALFIQGSALSAGIPYLTGTTVTGIMVYAQGAVYDATSGLISLSNTAAIRVDLVSGS